MPKRKTIDASTVVSTKRFAKGLHHPQRSRTYLFDDIRADSRVKQLMRLGRAASCDIRVDDQYTSSVHAVLQRREEDGATLVHDHSSTNGVYIDNQRMVEPTALIVGMRIQLGHSLFIAVDDTGSFPIAAVTVSEFCRKASELYGNNCLAAEHIGRSREFVRRQHQPREQRYKKR